MNTKNNPRIWGILLCKFYDSIFLFETYRLKINPAPFNKGAGLVLVPPLGFLSPFGRNAIKI
jgi:hypothetical protein